VHTASHCASLLSANCTLAFHCSLLLIHQAAQSGVLHDVLVPAPAVKQQAKAAAAQPQQQQQQSKGPRGSGSGSVNDASKLDAVTAASNAARLLLQKMESGGGSSTANGHNGYVLSC
jgi:hypothetical protein